MNFSIVRIIRRAVAPRHKISCSRRLWKDLLSELRARGRDRRESGAFLLGQRVKDVARITDFIPYDELDPASLDTGIVRFDGRYFGQLWDLCTKKQLTVVADVHTHPGGSAQSDSDVAHPMIACAGHLALIIPQFAKAPVRLEQVGMYRYLGARRWNTIPRESHTSFFHIGI